MTKCTAQKHKKQPDKALHWTGIPLRSIPASELQRRPCCRTQNPAWDVERYVAPIFPLRIMDKERRCFLRRIYFV